MSNRINPYKMFYGVWIPNWLMSQKTLTLGAKACYGELCRYAQEKGHSWPAQETLGRMMGISVRKVGRHIKELVDNKLIEVVHRGLTRTNVYYFLDHPWIHEDTPADDEVPEEPPMDNSYQEPDLPELSDQCIPELADRRESREKSHSSLRSEGDETPSARNLNSSGEKMAAWEDFLAHLSSQRSEGIQSPIFNPSSYARRCARNGGWPPDVDLDILFEVASAVKSGLGRKVVILPALEDLQDTATYFQKCRQVAGKAFVAWLTDTVSMVGSPRTGGSLADDKLLLHALTQAGTLKPFSEWEAERTVRA